MTQANKAKMTLGLINLPKVYTSVRNSLKAEMHNTGWVNKTISRAAAFNALCLHVLNMRPLRAFLPMWNGGNTAPRRALADALKWLIADVGQKEKLSRGQGNREFREVADESDDDDEDNGRRSKKRKRDPVSADLHQQAEQFPPSIMVTVVDPDALGAFSVVAPPRIYDWNHRRNQNSFVGILAKIAFPELCNLILKHTPPDRAIRSIWGALDNVPLASNPPVRPQEVQITDSEEVEVWLKNSTSRPRRVLAVLHRAGAGANVGGAETPPLSRAFPHIEEDDYTMVDIPAENSDYDEGNHRINAKGLRLYLPRTDASNQRLIQTLVRRRNRQQDAIDDLDPKYLRKYPLVVEVADANFAHFLSYNLSFLFLPNNRLPLNSDQDAVERIATIRALISNQNTQKDAPRAHWILLPAIRMPLNKRSAGSALLSAKQPRLPVPPEEHDDSQTDGSEISFRALTALSTGTRSSQSTSTRSSQSTTAPIARKELLRSTDTSTGRSSPRRVEFHLPNGNTDSAEVQEEQPEEHVPEVEETANTRHSEYDDSPENDQKSSEENPDVPEDQPQASTQQRSQSTGKRPRTVQPTTARALGNARRRPTGAVAEVIASSDVSVDVVQGQNANYSEGNMTGCEGNTERRSRESSTHFGTQTKCIPENAHRIPESVNFSAQPGSISESIPGISENFPGVSESTPDTLTLFYTAHKPFLDAFELSSSIREEENAPIAESEAAQVEYLLKNDRFLSPAQHYETYRLRFLAPEIIDILYYKYFDGVRMRGSQNESVVKTFNRMSNTWKGRSRQNQEATLEVIKDNLREKIREKKGITIEVIPEDGFSEDDEALAADLAAFRNARKALPSAREDISGSDNGGGQDEVVHAQLRGIEAEEEGEENEEEQEEGDHEGGEEEEDV
ncbi:hypothetical protein DFP73DRAFT_532538 [Morchella snyderi]|nr:hypothetical protein DFP73DRAFT_532538 [Morchella snyderi]